MTVKETPIGELPPSAEDYRPDISADSAHIAFLVRKDGKMRVVHDGVEGPAYNWIIATSLSLSPDGKRLGYIVQTGGRMSMVLDGKEQAAYDRLALSGVAYSADSRHAAYLAQKGDKWTVVLDGKEGKEYRRINAPPNNPSLLAEPLGLRFSSDSSHLGYWAELEPNKVVYAIEPTGGEGRQARETAAYHAPIVGQPVFSPDGKRVAWAARLAPSTAPATAPAAGRVRVTIDGLEPREHDEIALGTPVFSPDSRRVAYCARVGKEAMVVIDGVDGPRYENVSVPAFSPDSKRVAWWGLKGGKRYVVIDGKENGPYDMAANITFSPDSQRVAYPVGVGAAVRLLVDDKEMSQHLGIPESPVVFSPDSRHVAYVVRLTGPPATSVSLPATSPVRRDKSIVLLDGRELGEYDAMRSNMAFGPDGRHLAWTARRGARTFFVVDGVESGEFDTVVRGATLVWDGPTRFHTLVRKKDQVVRADVEVGE
jgi:Tol biopolymer transport system component